MLAGHTQFGSRIKQKLNGYPAGSREWEDESEGEPGGKFVSLDSHLHLSLGSVGGQRGARENARSTRSDL